MFIKNIEPYISPGNIRMKIPTFSIPAIKTCKGSTEHCRKYCYARKAEKRFKKVRESRERNLKCTKKFRFVKQMSKQIEKKKGKYFRIHESGDFYKQRYLNKWIKIARKFPDINFLAYTQANHLNFTKKPDNLIIYHSVWDDSKDTPKEGLKAFVKDKGNGKIGEYPIPKNIHKCVKGKDLGCESCLYCFEGRGDVEFELH